MNRSSRYRLFSLVAVSAALLPFAGSVPGRAAGEDAEVRGLSVEPAGSVYSLLDYFESGRRAVAAYVGDTPPATGDGLAGVIHRVKRACVRVDLRFDADESRYRSVASSGVLIEGGRRVLTAGHALENRTDYQAVITLTSGEELPARLVDHAYDPLQGSGRDWAVFEVVKPDTRVLPSVEFGAIRRGELAIILGYPDLIGVDGAGRVAHASRSEGSYFEPLVTLGAVESEEPLSLSPRVGSIPTGGMSGGPVLDHHGRLIGLFVSVRTNTTRSGIVQTYRAESIAPVRQRLASD